MNNTASPTNPNMPEAAEAAARLDSILAALLAVIAAHFRILGPLTIPLWTRISRARQLFARLLARIATGHIPRPHRPRTTPRPARPTPPIPVPPGHALGTSPVPPMSRRFAWVIDRIGYQAAGFASQLNHLLQQPGIAEIIAASPGAARSMRPLCRILGITLPAILRRPEPPPRPKPAAPPKPQLPPTPPLRRPLPAYVRAAVRAWKRGAQKLA